MEKKFIFIIILFIFNIFLVSCTPKFNFEKVDEMRIYEPMDEDHVGINFNPVKVTLNNCDFYFDSSISKKDQTLYLEFAKRMLSKIEVKEKLTYYIFDKFSNRVTNDIIYLKYSESYNNSNFLIFTLQKKYGVTANYGLLYGYSSYLMGNKSTIKIDKLNNLSNEETYLFDLTLPLFMDEYTPLKIINLTKEVSDSFVRYIINKRGEKKIISLIQKSTHFDKDFENEITTLENEWLKSLNVSIELSPLEIIIRYSNVSYFYPLKLETDWMEYYFQHHFLEKQEKIFSIRFNNYKELREFILITENEMNLVREFIGGDYSVDKYGKPCIYYVPDHADDRKKQRNADPTLHEYVHFITSDAMYRNYIHESYLSEGIANYLHYTYNPAVVEFEKEFIEQYEPIGDTIPDQFVLGYKQYMLDNNLEYNQFDVFDYLVYKFYLDISLNSKPHFQGASFVNYLIKTYGKDKFIEYFDKPSNIKSVYGKTNIEIVKEWRQFLSEKFE